MNTENLKVFADRAMSVVLTVIYLAVVMVPLTVLAALFGFY